MQNRHEQVRTMKLHVAICQRAEQTVPGYQQERMSMMMDLESLPDLDLQALLEADQGDFNHDISGIVAHMDRSSFPGRLTDCFEPRCMRRAASKEAI